MVPPRTKTSTPRLSELARKVVVPRGATSTGWPAVRDKCRDLGISFRPWQPGVGQIILSKRSDGKYAATIGGTGLSIPRQVGKTFLVACIVFALCLLNPNLTVIWTSHRLRTSEETFKKMQGFARRVKIKPHILKVVLGSGEEEIRFRNGSRILFGARERGFGRGFDEVDVLIFDEAQILSEAALDDMVPATNQSRMPTGALLLFMGTPPKPTDPGDVFTRMRSEALASDAEHGHGEDTAWIEFGADPDYRPTEAPADLTEADWHQVAKANPSYPHDTPREAILRMRKQLGAESMLREGFGIWPDVDGPGIFPGWDRLTGERQSPAGFGIAADVNLTRFVLGGATSDFVDIITPKAFENTGPQVPAVHRAKFVSEVARIAGAAPVALQERGPAWILKEDLELAGVHVVPVTFDEFVQACADFDEAVAAKAINHAAQTELDQAVKSAQWRTVGDRRVVSRKTSDIPELESVILARGVATSANYDPLASIY
jgi:hypothetical protein